eukprot:637730-Amorphochlora_amoeboformis.AAC.1
MPKGKKGKKKGNKGKRQKKGGEKKFDETKKVFNADDDYEKIEKTPLYLVENLASIKRVAPTAEISISDVVVDELDMVEPGKGKLLLAKTRLKLAQGRNYGLCGRNVWSVGIGKTTLLRLIASGSLKEFPAYLKVLHVRQEIARVEVGKLSNVASIAWMLVCGSIGEFVSDMAWLAERVRTA